jgi:CRISPR-associated protein Cas2
MEHLYIVSYDVCDPKRWRRIYRTLRGYGVWVQLSVFQCRMSRIRRVQLETALDVIVNHHEDHVLIMDLGPADGVEPKVRSIGHPFHPLQVEAVIV